MLSDLSIIRSHQSLPEIIEQKFFSTISKKGRDKLNIKMRNSVKNKDFTVIASFCGGGTLYHDLGMQFTSPTVNLAFDGKDFCSFCENLKQNLNREIIEYKTDKVPYPVGHIGDDIEVRFVHYKTFEEANEKWKERVKRINYEKIFIMATDRDGMNNEKCMERFDRLPYEKIMYTAKKYDYPWAKYCKHFRKKNTVGVMTGISDIHGHRFYEKYLDIVSFLNSL